ncbi:glycoside hydrolase family 5 protein [Astrocystis sublimbata]|nr:glycoside hydrolase family 5 protein [Astrocystis sublimbata]
MLYSSAASWLTLATASTAIATLLTAESDRDVPSVGRRWLHGDDKIRGVNLGSLFIIEEWFAQDAWASIGCKGFYDEWSCVKHLGQSAADAAFENHWKSWIIKDDITQIAGYGLNTIRIPVGFWIKEDLVEDGEYYPRGGLSYLDRIVEWAGDAGLYVIMDLHGAPGSQSPNEEFTGHSTANPGFFTAANYERANKFLEWMTERIHTNDAYRSVGMLQVINEPIKRRVNATDADDMLENFYPAAWDRIRARESKLKIAVKDSLHIQFMSSDWGSGHPDMYLSDTTNIYYDQHVYWKFDNRAGKNKTSYIDATCSLYGPKDSVIVGEFSLSVASDVQDTAEFAIQGHPENVEWYTKYFSAQVSNYEKSGGWVFWSWRCNWIHQFNDWRWCYKTAVEAGAIPKDASKAASLSPC